MARFPCNVTITVYPSQEIRLRQADIAKLRREELVGIWKVWIPLYAPVAKEKIMGNCSTMASRSAQNDLPLLT